MVREVVRWCTSRVESERQRVREGEGEELHRNERIVGASSLLV